MGYWEELDEHNDKIHKRELEWLRIKHKYKMEELNKEVELFIMKKNGE